MKIIWSPLSIDRLSEIIDYISQENPTVAKNIVDTIFTKVDKLIKFPKIGRIVPEANREEIRELIYKNYRIIYKIEKHVISILTVKHSRQILPLDDLTAQ